jgi:adenylate kinase family enzyme
MERVLVIGPPGAGKSTLATEIAGRTGLPLVHLDRHHWRPGWIEADQAEWERQVAALIAAERWVIDGNYGGTLAARLARADTAIWLDFPVWLCLARIFCRALKYRGQVRPDMAEGCPEQINREFLVYAARFPWVGRKRILAKLPAFTGRLIHLRRPSEAERFLRSLD